MPKFDSRSFVPKDAPPKAGAHRRSMSSDKSKRIFEKTASKTHYKNLPNRTPMRGGIRL